MRKILFLFFIFLFIFANAKNNPVCPNDGKQDATICLQQYINNHSNSSGQIILNSGIYKITGGLFLPSNIHLSGHNVTLLLESNISNTKLITINGESNIIISGINFIANGSFSESIYSNNFMNLKFNSGIGFTNGFSALFISGCAKNISVTNNKFWGFDFGINHQTNCPQNAKNINYSDNSFSNLGQSAIFIINGSNIQIENNKIDSVLGNIVVNNSPSLSDTKFADGIFISGVLNVIIESNNINNIKRIGIVVERVYDRNLNQNIINDNITISNNHITNVNGSRGTEYNAGIWVEGGNGKDPSTNFATKNITISQNLLDNSIAILGNHDQYGINDFAESSLINDNYIIGYNKSKSSLAIQAGHGNFYKIYNNILIFNSLGINLINKNNSKTIVSHNMSSF